MTSPSSPRVLIEVSRAKCPLTSKERLLTLRYFSALSLNSSWISPLLVSHEELHILSISCVYS